MEHIPQLVIDLALLLSAAAIATIVCRRFKQPLILGYVIAGFLVSPAIGWIPNVVDSESISTWSEIGVIFLMFGLGLEFSFVKLAKVGKSAAITALSEIVLMMTFGTFLGLALGWSFFTSLFLGAMLAVSSTTIIAKTVDELGLKGKKFANLAFGSLVVEDIASIFIMVVLSALAVGSASSGGAIFSQLGTMALYLIIWFVLSVLLVPSLIKKITHSLNDEILLITSVALCFLMVVLANVIGFSAALGAFLAGSILAGTEQVHRIEQLFKPLKDFFGAIFFVSVGMLVSPQMIVQNIVPILIVTVVTLLLKPLFSTVGALLAGQNLKTSVQTGMSLAQIGEFSFIIAGLGVSLGVTADFLYPIIVAVSVVTTITTPFYIKNSDKVYSVLEKILPPSFVARLDHRASSNSKSTSNSNWSNFLKHWIVKLAMVVMAAIASVLLFSELIQPLLLLVLPEVATNIISTALTLAIVGVFITNLFFSIREGDFGKLRAESRRNHAPLMLTVLVNLAVSVGTILYVFFALGGTHTLWAIIPALFITLIFAWSRGVHTAFLKLENLFIVNLSQNTLAEQKALRNETDPLSWVEEQMYVTTVKACHFSERAGRLISIDLAKALSCHLDLLSIKHNGTLVDPERICHLNKIELQRAISDQTDPLSIQQNDELCFIGTEDEIKAYLKSLDSFEPKHNEYASYVSLKKHLASSESDEQAITLQRLAVDSDSLFKGKTISSSGLKSHYGYLVLALEHNSLPVIKPSRNTLISQGDYLWIIGNSNANKLQPQGAE